MAYSDIDYQYPLRIDNNSYLTLFERSLGVRQLNWHKLSLNIFPNWFLNIFISITDAIFLFQKTYPCISVRSVGGIVLLLKSGSAAHKVHHFTAQRYKIICELTKIICNYLFKMTRKAIIIAQIRVSACVCPKKVVPLSAVWCVGVYELKVLISRGNKCSSYSLRSRNLINLIYKVILQARV